MNEEAYLNALEEAKQAEANYRQSSEENEEVLYFQMKAAQARLHLIIKDERRKQNEKSK